MPPPALSEFAALEATLEARRLQVEAALRHLHEPGQSSAVAAAMEDSLFAPAKRLRPILSLLVADVLRGRPTCHVAHGEAHAILAAFALLNRAFEILAQGWEGAPDATGRAGIAREPAKAIGLDGMIAGQATDLAITDTPIDFPTLEFIHRHKTGALFMASAALGAAAARAKPAEKAAVVAYAKYLGLAFQIIDDLIDATSGAAEAGKDVGKDLKKTTFVSFSGVAGARDLARELIAASQEALAGFGPRAQPLRELGRYVVTRRR